ncbi:AsmA family protein, partial [Aquisalimonas sp.]|uniref:AsmA family protein n=1 Tax=Aquisalimonas sp. TaxID=1872621 RepID=UPI0025C5BDF4
MPRIFMWLVIAFAALAGLVVVLIMALVLLVDPNDYRDDIEELVAKRTGHELVIDGDISLSFFPWLGLDLGRTRLENREGFGDDPFVSIDSAGVAVRLLPLLRLEVVLDTVRLEGLRANLIVNEAGEANWDFDLPVDEEEPEVTDEPPPEDEPPVAAQLPVTIGTIQGVRISDMHVTFEDWQTGVRHEAGPVNIRLGELVLDEDVSLDGDWAVSLGDATRLEGSLEALLRASNDLQRFRARIQALDLRTFAEGLPDEGLETSLSVLLEADLERDSASLSDLVVRSAGLRLNAAADVVGLTSDPRVDGRFDIPETDLRDVLERLQQGVPETADPDALRRFTMDGVFRASAERAELTELRVDLDGARLSGTGSVADFADPMIRFDLAGTRFEADRYLPPGTDEQGAGGVAVGEAGEEDPEGAEIPLEALRALNLDGRFRLEELLIAGFELSDINIQVHAEGGHIRIHPLVARLYGGEYHGDIRLDATGDALAVRVNERLSGVQAQPVVQQLLGRDLLRGTAGLHLEGETRGITVMDLVREFVARADLAFTEGDFIGVDLE